VYFVRRDGKVKGPLSIDRLRSLRLEQRLRDDDEIAEAKEGPWERVDSVATELLADRGSADFDFELDDSAGIEVEATDQPFAAASASARSKARGSGRREAEPRAEEATGTGWTGSMTAALDTLPVRIFGAAAVGLLVFLALFFASAEEEKTPPPLPPPPVGRLEAVVQPPPAASAAGPEAGDGKTEARQPPVPTRDGLAGPQQPAGEPSPDPPARPAAAGSKGGEHRTAIERLLRDYYTAGHWTIKYRHVVSEPRAQGLIKELYQDLDAIGGTNKVEFVKIPADEDLQDAIPGRRRLLVETRVNGLPHHMFVVHVDGGWKIAWMESFEQLWITK
jgi:hypothetical protein